MNNDTFLELLEKRCSCRRFSARDIDEETVKKLLLAADGAPVGSNLNEDIRITVVRDRAVLDELTLAMKRRREDKEDLKRITEKLRDGTAAPQKGFDPFYGAPVVIFVSHRRQNLQPGIEFSNVMSVAMMMHLEATALGLGSVFMWGSLEAMRMYPEYDRSEVLELPPDFQPLLGLAVGYPDNTPEKRSLDPEKFKVNFL